MPMRKLLIPTYLYVNENCEAEKYFLKYIKARPESTEARRVLGELYLKLRRFQDRYDEKV